MEQNWSLQPKLIFLSLFRDSYWLTNDLLVTFHCMLESLPPIATALSIEIDRNSGCG